MIFEGFDVMGDGVSIAARLQEISNRGCISISDSIYQQVKDKKGFSAEFLGERYIQNVSEPIKIYKVKCYNKRETSFETESPRSPNKHIIPYIIIILLLAILIITFLWSWLALPTQDDNNLHNENKSDSLSFIYNSNTAS
jgi:hypothetical protein